VLLTSPALLTALLLGGAGVGLTWRQALRRALRRQAAEWEARLAAERRAGQSLCFAVLESLACAIEATHSYDVDHLPCVVAYVAAMARELALPEEETSALRAAALLHNIGRLGVPEHILHKPEPLAPEEQEKLRSHPLLAAQLLEAIPFPWSVVSLVRHYTEHWDGTGYPDGLAGQAIPFGARLLAVAAAYSALQHARPFRAALPSEEAMEAISARAGTQFDPEVVALFRRVIAQMRAGLAATGAQGGKTPLPASALLGPLARPGARATLDIMAATQRETIGLFTLSQAVTDSLHLEVVGNTLLHSVCTLVPCAACVLFLAEDDGEFLRAQAAIGANARHLLGSLARVGTYLTGRAFSRGEVTRASFLAHDLILRDVSDVWIPFRSTLIVPLIADGQPLGTLNLYAEEPEAFGTDALRVMRRIAAQAGHVLENARRFAAVQETAYTDALTGLRNARYLREFLEGELNRSRRENTPLAVLNIDLDNFKPINDTYGHARGDQTLREIAHILHTHIRNYDLAARYAGDEFVVVLSRTGRIPAEAVAAKLKQAVQRHCEALIASDPNFPPLGISIGIALFPEDSEDQQGLLCRSDAAMYLDKQQRRAQRAASGDGLQAA